MQKFYQARREKVYEWMAEAGIGLLIFEDSERARDASVRYLTGQPGDALVFLSAEKKCLLVPWDVNMAKLYAFADETIPYNNFEMNAYQASRAAASYFKLPYGARLEVPPSTTYPGFLKYVEQLGDYDVLCRDEGGDEFVRKLRAKKDEAEMRIYKLCSEKTNEVIDLIEKNVLDKTLKTEADVALFIEAECRKRGCDGTGFGTLAAGAERSFGIHCFPPYTGGAFAGKGLSILDFGLVYQGYTSDVTMTFASSIDKAQQKQLKLTEAAFKVTLDLLKETFAAGKGEADEEPSIGGREIALAVDAFFKKEKVFMPHGLGHGIGLETHEAPFLRRSPENKWRLERSMIFTVEPGLYDPINGGCRLENDVFIGESGPEILTRSRVVHL